MPNGINVKTVAKIIVLFCSSHSRSSSWKAKNIHTLYTDYRTWRIYDQYKF